MHNTSFHDKDRFEYIFRKDQIDKDFVWTDDIIKHLYKLNDDISKLQNQLVNQMRAAYDLFFKLEKSGMSFLHGFKIVGNIGFMKEIVEELYCAVDMTDEQKAIVKKWECIEYYSAKEIDAWQLVFDSKIEDFMPLSKTRINEKRHIWNLKTPLIDNLLYCSYFAHFLDFNSTFSNADLIECTVKDFYPEIKVVVNHNVSELRAFSKYHPARYYEFDFNRCILERRKEILDKTFEWNEVNIQKIMDVNSWIWKRTDELKSYMTEVNAAFHILSETEPEFANYSIDGQIEYHGNEANDIATIELQQEMSRQATFEDWNLGLSETQQKIGDEIHKDEAINWNREVYWQHLSEDQRKVYFHYLMHILFVDGDIYSFQDLVRMREEDFKVCMSIEWAKE